MITQKSKTLCKRGPVQVSSRGAAAGSAAAIASVIACHLIKIGVRKLPKKIPKEKIESFLKRYEESLQKEKERLIKECGASEEEAEKIIESFS